MILAQNEIPAVAKYIRSSPHKVRRVLDQIRGRSYREALIILEFLPYRSAEYIIKVLRSAVANAEHNAGLDPATLVVGQAFADGDLASNVSVPAPKVVLTKSVSLLVTLRLPSNHWRKNRYGSEDSPNRVTPRHH